MDKNTGPQVKPVIQPLRDQYSDIQFDDRKISDILVNTHITKQGPPVGQFDDTWMTHVDHEAVSYEKETLATHTPQENYNVDIMDHEMDEAISRLKCHSSPGLDKMLPVILTLAGPKLSEACWSQGSLPSILKEENQIHLPKEEKRGLLQPKVLVSQVQLVGKSQSRSLHVITFEEK